MSSFRISLVCLLFLGLAACGFQPLYGSATQNADVQTKLADIYIPPIKGRTGQILRNELLDLTTPKGLPSAPKYRLTIGLTEAKTGLAIQSDDTKTRFNLTLNTYFNLINTSDDSKIYNGSTQTIASYNVVASDFANLAAEINAEKRAALVAAEQIHQQLSVYFAGR
ncbi:LPS assembly lipoprotein LptE [Sneathiella marina]|uniref:LPS assembly lipoprotein LptE n=1 Tax=Sneathiella marina TaxID=2950108 RepID=A0ABY4W826_9PROT|nr:LPS assembly lipoprotein LptE [Sneathiella marina]USG61429.1 LPS assembly lipoprotein LptE [Sneathiella marina]